MEHYEDILDRALGNEASKGLLLDYDSKESREKDRKRLYAAMGKETRRAKSANPWAALSIVRVGEKQLWIGRLVASHTRSAMNVSLEDAQ